MKFIPRYEYKMSIVMFVSIVAWFFVNVVDVLMPVVVKNVLFSQVLVVFVYHMDVVVVHVVFLFVFVFLLVAAAALAMLLEPALDLVPKFMLFAPFMLVKQSVSVLLVLVLLLIFVYVFLATFFLVLGGPPEAFLDFRPDSWGGNTNLGQIRKRAKNTYISRAWSRPNRKRTRACCPVTDAGLDGPPAAGCDC